MYAIEFNNISKKFRKGEKLYSLRDAIPRFFKSIFKKNGSANEKLDSGEFWVLKDVDFKVKKGEVLGIIGPNGAGKSTILKLLARILKPNRGEIKVHGRLSALIEITAGFHPEFTGRENIYFNGAILGMSRKEIDSKFESIVEFSGVRDFIDTPVKRYSSGMGARLGFAIAAHVDPEVLLVDEVLSVGDMTFQAKCAQKMRELLASGTTIIFISHNISLVQSLCERILLLQEGKIIKNGYPEEVIPYYRKIVLKEDWERIERDINQASDNYGDNNSSEALFLIHDVRFYGLDNEHKKKFKVGEPIKIEVDYENKGGKADIVVVYELLRSDGVVCCSSNTKDDDVSITSVRGQYTLTISMGKLKLGPDVYYLKVAIWDKDMVQPYIIKRKGVFNIEIEGLSYQLRSILLPETKWQITKKN
jgi:lipopolysaccharide transport system ATP-binding protein